MTIIKHELKQGKMSLLVWTASIAFLLMICVFMFPEMKGEMDNVSDMFAGMGSFTEAFGMDRLNFGELIGFYGVECGNILGLGGAFFAALTAILSLAKEEKEHTAEFLFTHPVSRRRVIIEKLVAVILQIIIMNVIVMGLALLSVVMIGEKIPFKEMVLLHFAYFIMEIELSLICFGISAFIRRGGLGIGLGIAAVMYFLNIIANIAESAEWLKYITPFGYTEGADIISDCKIDGVMVALGMCYGIVAAVIAFVKYERKDIAG